MFHMPPGLGRFVLYARITSDCVTAPPSSCENANPWESSTSIFTRVAERLVNVNTLRTFFRSRAVSVSLQIWRWKWDFPQKQTNGTHLMSVSKLIVINLLVHYIVDKSPTEIKNKHSQADVQKSFVSTIQRSPLLKCIQDVSSYLPKSMHFSNILISQQETMNFEPQFYTSYF